VWAFGLVSADAHAAIKQRTVPGELRRMLRAGAIDATQHDARRAEYGRVKKTVKRLPAGLRRNELGAVVRSVDGIAARGSLTVSRLAPLWLTLERNRHWWTTQPLPASGKRVSFLGSELVWQYYPGQGFQLQPLANFGKLNGLWQGKLYDDRLAMMLDELLAIAAKRGNGLAWEYYFTYTGGRPPWVSGLAQGTAVQALARAAIRLDRKEEVLPLAEQALAVFEERAPTGVRVPIDDGAHYAIYSFRPALRVLNGFLQALVGLSDFAGYANNERARGLFADGDRVARREVPGYDTGAWSLYSRGDSTHESDLSYHRLLTGFLQGLCTRTERPVYCETASNFTRYETEKPKLELLTSKLRGGTNGRLRFGLSKISRVGVRVALGSKLVFTQPAFTIGYGKRSLAWRVPRRAGTYRVALTAVDLAGNVGSTEGEVEVSKPKPRKHKH
jgi:D-glucuronyl C5-epimerase C-terminus